MAKRSRKGAEGSEKKSGSFIVLFTALSTILLALFIMMNAQSIPDELKVKEVWSSVQDSFSVLKGGVRVSPGKDLQPPGAPVVMANSDDWADSVLFAQMIGFFREQPLGFGVVAEFDRDELVISIPADVLFQPGTRAFRSKTRSTLRMIAHVVRRTRNPVEIGGRADDARAPETNWDLSSSRSLAVAEWIVGKGRVDPRRIRAVAFAEHNPMLGRGSVPRKGANRRVSIRFLSKQDVRLMPFSGVFNFRGFLFKVRSLMGEK